MLNWHLIGGFPPQQPWKCGREKALGTETTVELGGEFIDSGHKNIRKLAQELGLVEVDLLASVCGSYACYLVGKWTKFAGVEGERVGNLFFIGEHYSIEAQGYMEGECATGVMASSAILKDLKPRSR